MIRSIMLFSGLNFLLGLASVSCFTTVAPSRSMPSKLYMNNQDKAGENERRTAVSVVAAAYLFANVFSAAPAFADFADFGSTEIVAGRSGGRMGGRSMSRPPPSMYRPSPTVINRQTTIVSPSRVMVAPSPIFMPSPFMPSPFGFGFGYGLGGGFGGGGMVRDYRQDSELARERAELEVTKERQAELEARIRQMEQQSQQQAALPPQQSQELQMAKQKQLELESRIKQAEPQGQQQGQQQPVLAP